MGENEHREPTYEVWVQDLTDRNLFVNRRLALKVPESALKERSSIVLKIVYDGERPSTLPFGYIRDTAGQIGIDPAMADVVCRVFELHAQGLSIEKIAKKIEGKTSDGNTVWHASNVREILDHEDTYYSGLLESDSSLHLPPILKYLK